jgi:hypothetical protein
MRHAGWAFFMLNNWPGNDDEKWHCQENQSIQAFYHCSVLPEAEAG